MSNKESSIQIIGGGTFGLSSAYYLAKDGYKNITVIDRETVPSTYSAGYDLNKIIRVEYEDQFYLNLALDAVELWESPEFKPFFHKVGYVNCNSGDAPEKSFEAIETFKKMLRDNKRFPADSLVELKTVEDFQKVAPQLKECDFKGWSGYLNKHAGYAHALKAMTFVADECKKMGVKFVVDRAEKVLYSDDKSECTGVKGESGKEYLADLTIISMGAHVTRLFPELHKHVSPQAWSVGHLELSKEDAQTLAGVPVVNCRDIGFFFEPDADGNILKMCNTSAGWVNKEKDSGVSVTTESNDGICKVDLEGLTKQVNTFFPQWKDRKIVRRKICWCCDRENSDFVIDYHPRTSNLFFATADSGHAFKMLPIFGKWVLARLQGTLTEEQQQRWKWFEEEENDDVFTVAWRLGKVLNLHEEDRV